MKWCTQQEFSISTQDQTETAMSPSTLPTYRIMLYLTLRSSQTLLWLTSILLTPTRVSCTTAQQYVNKLFPFRLAAIIQQCGDDSIYEELEGIVRPKSQFFGQTTSIKWLAIVRQTFLLKHWKKTKNIFIGQKFIWTIHNCVAISITCQYSWQPM